MHYITRDKGNEPPPALPPHLPTFCLDPRLTPFHPLACVCFLPFPKLSARPAPEPARHPALGVQTFCSRQISMKEAGAGPAITLFAEGLPSLFWKESVVNHMSEVSCEEKPASFQQQELVAQGVWWGHRCSGGEREPNRRRCGLKRVGVFGDNS